MSLENEIKKLREAIEANTKAINDKPVETLIRVEEPVESEKVPELLKEVIKETEKKEDNSVSLEGITALCNDFINKGIERKKIKALIKECGANKLSELDDQGRRDLADKLLASPKKEDK